MTVIATWTVAFILWGLVVLTNLIGTLVAVSL